MTPFKLTLLLSNLGTVMARVPQRLQGGQLLDAGGGSYAESPRRSGSDLLAAYSNDVDGCKSYCEATYPTLITELVGYSYLDDGVDADDRCTCYRVRDGNAEVVGEVDTAQVAVYGDTFCYSCRQKPGSDVTPAAQPSRPRLSNHRRLQTSRPTHSMSPSVSGQPSSQPSEAPSSQPSAIPSELPSGVPSEAPSGQPSSIPSELPSGVPSESPSGQPSSIPSEQPSSIPSENPSGQPSSIPSEQPSSAPSEHPSSQPSSIPSEQPSGQPSSQPSTMPSSQPSESPSANPSQGCANTGTDCGWGIFNPWTCRCDCPVGICLDNNEQCYNPCADTINTNPWAGCSPGWDCPWFPDTPSGHCLSELHQPNNFEIYRTSKECCDTHFTGSSTCLQESKDSHDPFPWPIHFPGLDTHRGYAPPTAENFWGTEASHTVQWFPDLINKLNCVNGKNYENWMQTEGFEEHYLFANSADCCEKWYPALGSSCPDNGPAVNPEAEDEPWHSDPYSALNYFFPDFSQNNCGFGRDYPAWMGYNAYEKHYLFQEGNECCSKFFPTVSGCPYENTVQNDYYWTSYQDNLANGEVMPIIYNHTYYPDIFGQTCVNGTDYPAYMASETNFKRQYLFKTLAGCCTFWYTESELQSCADNVVQGVYEIEPCPTNRPDCNNTSTITNQTEHMLGMWYPDIDEQVCRDNGLMPSWMLAEDYTEWYLFNTRSQCCSAFGFC